MFTRTALIFFLLTPTTGWSIALTNRANNVEGDLLPAGLWMTGYDYGWSGENDSRFSNQGAKANFSQSISQDLKVKDILQSIDDSVDRGVANGAFQAYGLDQESQAGRVENVPDIRYSAQTFVLGRGITPHISFFIAAPKIKLDMSFETRMQYSAAIKNMVTSLRAQGQNSKADEIELQEKNALASQLQRYSYDKDYISSWEGVPQILSFVRYKIPSLQIENLSFETGLVIPTEHEVYNSQFMPIELFEESPSLTQSLYYTPYISDLMRISGVAQYQYRTGFHKNLRVPRQKKGDFTSDQEELHVRYGDEYKLGLQYDLNYLKWGKLFLHSNFIGKAKDHYQGDQYSDSRYDLMEEETEQEMLLAGGGVQLNLVDAFLRNKFVIPLIVTAQYSKTVAGKNVFDNEFYGLNLLVFVQ